MRTLIVTGKLAEETIRELISDLSDADVLALPVSVASFITVQYAAKELQKHDLSKYDRLLMPGATGGDLSIIEEAIGNVRKHAKAANLWIRLHIRDNNLVAEVQDDGEGFDVEAVQVRYDERGSLGMINMYERAELVNGTLSITSAPGKGTRVTLVAPLPRR